MGFDWQAFATGFLQQTAKNQTEAREDARNYEERQRQLAERNAQTISKRRAVANQVVGLTNMLRDNGASQEVIQAAVSAGPQSVVELANKVNSARETLGRNLSSDDIESLVNMPEGFSVIDMDTEDFIRKTYGLGYEGAGTSEETVERTFMDRLTGRKLRDAARARLDSEVMMDGLTAYDINQMAAQQDYESLVPGTFITFNEMKVFDPTKDLGSFASNVERIQRIVKESDEYKNLEAEYKSAFVNDEKLIPNIVKRQKKLMEDALSSTIENMYKEYGDSFLESAAPVLKTLVSEEYLNSISAETEEEEPAEPDAEVADIVSQTEEALAEPSIAVTELPDVVTPEEEQPEEPEAAVPEQEVIQTEPDDVSIALLESDGNDMLEYLLEKGVKSEEEMVIALSEWGQKTGKTMPLDKGPLIFALKPYVLEQ